MYRLRVKGAGLFCGCGDGCPKGPVAVRTGATEMSGGRFLSRDSAVLLSSQIAEAYSFSRTVLNVTTPSK